MRALARALGLPSADKPAPPCLASRIPHFTEVDPTRLGQVEAAEAALRQLGFADGRVRHHGDVERVELLAEDLSRAVSSGVREHLVAAVTAHCRVASSSAAGLEPLPDRRPRPMVLVLHEQLDVDL